MADENASDAQEVAFHYLKSSQFRVIHADGVWGGLSPQGNIRLVFFNERPPIPQLTVNKVDSAGVLGKDVPEKKVGRSGFVREMEVDVVLSLELAEGLRKWLDDKIATLKDLRQKGAGQPRVM